MPSDTKPFVVDGLNEPEITSSLGLDFDGDVVSSQLVPEIQNYLKVQLFKKRYTDTVPMPIQESKFIFNNS